MLNLGESKPVTVFSSGVEDLETSPPTRVFRGRKPRVFLTWQVLCSEGFSGFVVIPLPFPFPICSLSVSLCSQIPGNIREPGGEKGDHRSPFPPSVPTCVTPIGEERLFRGFREWKFWVLLPLPLESPFLSLLFPNRRKARGQLPKGELSPQVVSLPGSRPLQV